MFTDVHKRRFICVVFLSRALEKLAHRIDFGLNQIRVPNINEQHNTVSILFGPLMADLVIKRIVEQQTLQEK